MSASKLLLLVHDTFKFAIQQNFSGRRTHIKCFVIPRFKCASFFYCVTSTVNNTNEWTYTCVHTTQSPLLNHLIRKVFRHFFVRTKSTLDGINIYYRVTHLSSQACLFHLSQNPWNHHSSKAHTYCNPHCNKSTSGTTFQNFEAIRDKAQLSAHNAQDNYENDNKTSDIIS